MEGISARVLYSDGMVAMAILVAHSPKKRGKNKVVKILRADADFVPATFETEVKVTEENVAINTGLRGIAQTHGCVCGGTSVKTSNREERGSNGCVSHQLARKMRCWGWKFEQRRATKSWRTKADYRKARKIAKENREILLTQ